MRIEEYTARQDEIKKRAEIFGTHYESDFYDKDHLDCFWYDGKSQATFEYKGYAICFDVVGDKSISVFSEDFKSFEHIRRKAGSQPFYDVDEARELVKDDETLKRLVLADRIGWDNNNWIEVVIICQATGESVCEPDICEGSNLLEEVEGFEYYIRYIDEHIIGSGGN